MGQGVTARAELLGLQGTRSSAGSYAGPEEALAGFQVQHLDDEDSTAGEAGPAWLLPPKPPSLGFISLDRDWKRDRVA